jgi:hypothetical protein
MVSGSCIILEKFQRGWRVNLSLTKQAVSQIQIGPLDSIQQHLVREGLEPTLENYLSLAYPEGKLPEDLTPEETSLLPDSLLGSLALWV